MANILLIGNGAREHALAEAIMRSGLTPVLFSYMKSNNPGISALSKKARLGSYADLKGIVAFARENRIDFAVIGPEDQIGRAHV
jgi:phosphoribosylamine---glycine ligase